MPFSQFIPNAPQRGLISLFVMLFQITASAEIVINLNVGTADAGLLGELPASSTAAPVSYSGSVWNRLEGKTTPRLSSHRATAENMLDSMGVRTTASVLIEYQRATLLSEAPLAINAAALETGQEASIVVGGLSPGSIWDVIIVTPGTAEGDGASFTLGGLTLATAGATSGDSTFTIGTNFARFAGLVADESGRIEGIWSANGSSQTGYISAVQLVPAEGTAVPYSRIGFGEWFRGGGDQDGTVTSTSPEEFSMSWVQNTGRTDTSSQTILDAPVYLADGESLQFSFTVTDIVSVSSVDLPFRFGLLNDESATVGNTATFIAHIAWGVPIGFTKLRASVNTDGNEFGQGTDIFDRVSTSPPEMFFLLDGNTVDFSYRLTKYSPENYAVEIVWGSGEDSAKIVGSGYVPPYAMDHFNRVFVLVNQTMPGGASFRVVNPTVEKRFTFFDGNPVVDEGGLDYEVPVQSIPLGDPMSLPVLNTASPEFGLVFSSVSPTSTTATGYGFEEGAEALQAVYAYLHPESPHQGLESYLNRLLVLLEARFSTNWDAARDFNMDGAFQSVYAYALLKHYEPAVAASQSDSWERGIRKMVTQVLASKPLLYDQNVVADLWLNGDIRLALACYVAGIALGEPDWMETIAKVMEDVVTRTVMPDGGTYYVGYNTEVPTYHAESIQFMLWWWVLTGSERMLDAVARTVNWVPLTTEPAGAIEQSSSITYKHRYNGIFANSAALWKAYLFGDRYNYYFGQTAEGNYEEGSALMDVILYRPGLEPLTPPNQYFLHDRSIGGPRGRFGEWAVVGIGRNVQTPEPDSLDRGYQGMMTGKSTFVGALMLDPNRSVPHRNSFIAALDGVTLQVKYDAGPEPVGEPGSYAPYERLTNSWFLAQDEETRTVTRKGFGTIGTAYNLSRRRSSEATPTWSGWATDWRGRQLWYMDKNRLIGLVDLQSNIDQEAYSVNARALISGGRSGIIGQHFDFVDQGGGRYGFGPLRMKVHYNGFGGDMAVDRVGVDNRDGFIARVKLQDVTLGGAETLRSYLQGTSKGALLEFTRDEVNYSEAEPLSGLPEGLLGFQFAETGRHVTLILNTTGSPFVFNGSVDALYGSNSLHRSWSDAVEPLQSSGSVIQLDSIQMGPWGHIVVVGSDNPSDHEEGYYVYEDLFNAGGGSFPDPYWTLSAGDGGTIPSGEDFIQLNGRLDRIQPEGLVSLGWQVVSGPGEVVFSDNGNLSTRATFSAPGSYVIELVGSDGQRTATDRIEVSVSDPTGTQWAVLHPVADATLTTQGASTNATTLLLANDSGGVSDAYLKFEIPAHIDGFTGARLGITVTEDTGIGVLMAFAASPGTWSESDLSPESAPIPLATFLDRFSGPETSPFSPGETLLFDVSEFVIGPGEYNFVLRLTAGSNDLQVASRESLRPPFLELEGVSARAWAHYAISPEGFVDTGPWLGYLKPAERDWVYVYLLGNYIYLPEAWVSPASGSFVFLLRDPSISFLVDNLPIEGALPTTGWINTQSWMGWLMFDPSGWTYSTNLAKWIWMPSSFIGDGGAWIYFSRN